MKEHILRELVNRLRDTAVKNHDKECLRDLILKEVLESLNADVEWHLCYPPGIKDDIISQIKTGVPYPRKGQIGNE